MIDPSSARGQLCGCWWCHQGAPLRTTHSPSCQACVPRGLTAEPFHRNFPQPKQLPPPSSHPLSGNSSHPRVDDVPAASIQDRSEGSSQPKNPRGIGWALCCHLVVAHLLPRPIPLPSLSGAVPVPPQGATCTHISISKFVSQGTQMVTTHI